jgi:dUTP pyrophosphatase
MTFPTGIAIEPVSPDMAGFIYSRSGLGAMHGLIVAQGVGVIDPDYRGEITVVLLNTSKSDKEVRHGERIAQIVFQPVWRARIEEVDSLATSARGEGGFGHSGKL